MIESVREKINSMRLNMRSILRKILISRSMPEEKVGHLRKTVHCASRWHGSSYGGFYVLPFLLKRGSVVYSFGIGKDVTFDLAMIKKYGCEVYAFDPTPKSITWIQRQKLPDSFHFHAFGICKEKSGFVPFYLPKDAKAVSGSLLVNEATSPEKSITVLMKSFADIAAGLGHTHIDVLKMDIEGSEYDVLDAIVDAPVIIDQILVEIHDRDFPADEPKSRALFEKLLINGYEIFAVSLSYEEVSLVRKEKLAQAMKKAP
jgi:FkbM family methyltransferase